jgi:hypothetical protein
MTRIADAGAVVRKTRVMEQSWLKHGVANSPSVNPQQDGGDRQVTVLVVDDDPALQTMIFDYFVDSWRSIS